MSLGVCTARDPSAAPSLATSPKEPAFPAAAHSASCSPFPGHYLDGAGVAPAPVAQAPRLQRDLPRGNNELILVVDDEKTVLRVVRATLEKFGYRVVTAANGAEALSHFTRDPDAIDAVFTDMAMPVMDGPAMAAAIRAIDPDVKIIASSGLSARFGAPEVAMPGLSEFLPKPFTAEALLAVVARVLGTGTA